jgi:predicted transcriptional regulator
MKTAKEEVRQILDQLPAEVSFDEIQYHIYVRQKIDRGLDDAEAGRVLSEEEVEKRMSKWLEP